MRRLSVVICTLLVSPTLAAQTNAGATSPPIVAVSGTASKSIPADHATVYIAVETHASTAEQAGRENARVQHSVVAALRGAGVDSADMSAGNLVRPDTRLGLLGNPTAPGFVATNSVRVEVRRLDRIGALIDTALAAGANRVSGITFTSSAEREARRSVLAEAVANARSDAEAIATAAGGSLGRLIELNTQQGDALEALAIRQATIVGVVSQTDVGRRAVDVRVTVNAKWEFMPKP